MSYLDIAPSPRLLEESRRELERERRLQRRIREARAGRARQPSRFATVAARLRRRLEPDPCPPLADGC